MKFKLIPKVSVLRICTVVLMFLGVLQLSAQHKEEDVVSLNGTWKFNTISGQGYNYLNVKATAADIIIDNSDTEKVEVKGNWKSKKQGARETSFYKDDYLARNFVKGESKDNYVRFRPNLEKSGYYEAFVRYPFSSHLTSQCNIKHAGEITTKYVSQRVFCGEWISVGIYQFDKKDDNYIEITAITDGQVAADAVMLKPISEASYTKAKKMPKQIYLPSFNDTDWHNLKVPGHWGMINSYSNYTGIGWYRKSFDVPSNWSSKNDEKIRIQFGAVYHLAKVYLNGKYIGKHQGGLTPFEFDVTDDVKFGEKNVIAVEVNNAFIVGATWNWGGIIRGVQLKKQKNVRIQNQYIHAEPNLENGTAAVSLKIKIENNSNSVRKVNVLSKIKEIRSLKLTEKGVEIAPNSSKTIMLTASLKSKDVNLWHFDNPTLYTLQTTITENKSELDAKVNDFGIRKIEVTDSQLLLNGEPIRTGGFNRVSENRYYGSSEPIEILERDVDLMKESGANFMRIMHGTQNEELIKLCDRKGILLFEEVNVRDLTNPEFTAPEYPLVKSWLKEMIERDNNHPSIIGWSVGNELSDHYDYAKKMMDYVRTELDEHRLVTCVSNSGQKKAYTRTTDPNTHVDVIMHNMYRWQGEPQEILNTLREKWPNKSVFISEYGFDPYPTASLDGDKPIVSEWNQHFRGKNQFVIGSSMWTFNDYRSGYAGTSAEENRVWGVVNVWGQKRRLFDRFQKENSPIKILKVEDIDRSKKSIAVEITSKEASDYPSYQMSNYQLVATFTNKKGEVLYEQKIKLPTIEIGATWKGCLRVKKHLDAYQLKVKVINPLGYERGKKEIFFKVPNAPSIDNVIAGQNNARVYFTKAVGVKEYKVAYKVKGGAYQFTGPTISNFIDVEGLTKNKYAIALIAINTKGKSALSKEISIELNNSKLPPVVWEPFIDDKKLVIGYASDFEDEVYTVVYGFDKNNLLETFTTNVRGMMTINLNNQVVKPLYFKIKRIVKGKSSSWSPVQTVNP
ncbi:glycoside hydrolase family 2 TIM barrel-domain containing protein [Wenyingzhuangia sp. 1_MG-2023]|nr:glycoside hydrolase family 2 TIM barrel-domain containing protein [Wenyingzhuangia sp. 1_MG-2023]